MSKLLRHQHASPREPRPGFRAGAGFFSPAALVLLLLPVGLGLPGLADSAHGQQPPAIRVEPDSLDLGVMNQFEEQKHQVTIWNDGGSLLKIERIETGCGCTATDVKSRELAPGDQTSLQIIFNSQKFGGPITKSVKIHTNDPVKPTTEVVLQVHVRAPVKVEPGNRQIGYGKVRVGHTKKDEVWLSTKESIDRLEVTNLRWNEEVFAVRTVRDENQNPRRVGLEIEVLPTAPVGNHREFLRIETNAPDAPPIEIELFADVVHDLFTDKTRIRFGYAQKNKPLESFVRVRAVEKGIEFKVTGAEIDLPDFEIEIEETVPNLETRVNLKGKPLPTSDPRVQEAEGRLKGTLRIFTDLPHQPELEVTVLYMLKL
jgi:hypothetical protein